jgi:CDP-glycerol glycerophosphotransferase
VLNLSIELVNGRFRRRGVLGGLRPGSPSFPSGGWVREGLWVQPRAGRNGRLVLDVLDHPARLTSATVSDGSFVLSGVLPPDVGPTRLSWGEPSADRVRSVALERFEDGNELRFRCRIPLLDVVAEVDTDDPLWERSSWVLRVDDIAGGGAVLAAGLDQAVGLLHDSLLVVLTRLPDNSAALQVSPVQFTADHVGICSIGSQRRLVARGPLWGGRRPRALVWRPKSEEAGDVREVACEIAISGDRWSADEDLDHLTSRAARWTLYALPADGHAQPVRAEAFLSSRLPIELGHGDRTVTVIPEDGQLRAVVV